MKSTSGFIVYVAEDLKTGKRYVGCTTKGLHVRKQQHLDAALCGSPYKFHKALRESGLSSFHWRVLGQASSEAQMYALERRMISVYDTYRNGYNSTPGGQGSSADRTRWQMRHPKPKKDSPCSAYSLRYSRSYRR